MIEQHELDSAEKCLLQSEHETIEPLLGIVARMKNQPKMPTSNTNVKESVSKLANKTGGRILVNELDSIKEEVIFGHAS